MDCWFIAFENVSYRTLCKHKILCFATKEHYKCLKKCMGGVNVAVQVSITIDAAGNLRRAMARILSSMNFSLASGMQ
jgi:hypothetical protein